MSIKAHCEKCGGSFQAKDTMAGKRVKCPKCAEPLTIPASPSQPKTAPAASTSSGSGDTYNPLLDLLDEEGVKSASRGPLCPNCSADILAGSVICVECGYNIETGVKIETFYSGDEDSEAAEQSMTASERLLRKAEQELDESEDSVDPDNFGDGADSFVIAMVAGIVLLVLVGIGLAIVFSMEWISQFTNSGAISFLAAIFMSLMMAAWITVVAFMHSPGHGIACIATGSFWCICYGFMQGRQLLIPTLILLFSNVVGIAAGIYVSYNGFGPLSEF